MLGPTAAPAGCRSARSGARRRTAPRGKPRGSVHGVDLRRRALHRYALHRHAVRRHSLRRRALRPRAVHRGALHRPAAAGAARLQAYVPLPARSRSQTEACVPCPTMTLRMAQLHSWLGRGVPERRGAASRPRGALRLHINLSLCLREMLADDTVPAPFSLRRAVVVLHSDPRSGLSPTCGCGFGGRSEASLRRAPCQHFARTEPPLMVGVEGVGGSRKSGRRAYIDCAIR